MTAQFTIRNVGDIAEIEKVPLSERVEGASTYELIEKGASIDPGGVAISFMLNGEM